MSYITLIGVVCQKGFGMCLENGVCVCGWQLGKWKLFGDDEDFDRFTFEGVWSWMKGKKLRQ